MQRSVNFVCVTRCVIGVFCMLGLLVFQGCGTEPIRLNMVLTESANLEVKQVVNVYLRPMKEEAFGRIGDNKVLVSGFMDCVAAGLSGLGDADMGFRVVPDDDTVREDEEMDGKIYVSVVKAYIHNLMISKSAIVVLKMEHGGKVSYFRGQTTGVIWFGADAEFRSGIQKALGNALRKLHPALLSVIKEKQP